MNMAILMNGKHVVRAAIALLMLCAVLSTTVQAQTTLRMGSNDSPLNAIPGAVQRPGGMFGGLLSEIAQRENWQIEVVPCQWVTCLQMLEEGTIDILPDVSYTPERDLLFDFHQTDAVLSWSQVYERNGLDLINLLDLNESTIAVLDGSVQQRYMMELVDSFDLAVDWLMFDSLAATFDAVASGMADVAVASHFYGDRMAVQFGLGRTPIMFQPSRIFFAVPAGMHADVLSVIDNYLVQWKSDDDSPYYSLLREWSVEPAGATVPVIVWWIIASLSLALVATTLFVMLLRFKVAEKTRNLMASESRLNTILNSVDAYIYIKDDNLRYRYVNRKVCELFELPVDKILGKTDADFFDEKTHAQVMQNDLLVIRSGERVADEEPSTLIRGHKQYEFLSVKIPLRNPDNSIYALCGISTDIAEHKQVRDQLHQLAFYDSLTGLPNRRLVLDRLGHALASKDKTGYEGALLFVDVDDFKVVNDTLGHEVGDQLLQLIGERLERVMLSTDTAGRLGADEFVLIVEDLAVAADECLVRVRDMAVALLHQLNQPFDLNGTDHVCAISIGIAMFSDTNDGDVEALLKAADLALGAAKNEGNAVRFFNSEMQVEVTRRTRIETALRKALRQGSLNFHLQSQVDESGRIFGMEALLRWHDPELGQVAPSDFIPVAETCGLIVPLGEWVIERACEMLASWQSDPLMSTLTLAINISPRQFHNERFVDHAVKCLEKNQIDATKLELEVTEGLLIENVAATVDKMDRLRQLGIRFSLDDFGTGYASLGYLKRLPLMQLKIDQSFVRDLLVDANDEAIVRTILALGHSLNLRVLAEGVETDLQAERLREMGCRFFQGYFFSRPQPEPNWREQLLLTQGSDDKPGVRPADDHSGT
jgi:diguanylate cyclase (GGDEF)-like protein/PAS domain S-box-containing protein